VRACEIWPEAIGPFLKAEKAAIVLCCSALLANENLTDLAASHGGRIVVPSGALLGPDAVNATAQGVIEPVTIVTRKLAQGFFGAPFLAENKIGIPGITEPMRVFKWSARRAPAAPANLNVAVALSPAGIGPDRTQPEIRADPALSRNVHSIPVKSDSAEFEMSIRNVPLANPKTERITALSVIAALRRRNAPRRIGRGRPGPGFVALIRLNGRHSPYLSGCVPVSCRPGGRAMNDTQTLSERADALEDKMSRDLDYIVIKSRLHLLADGDTGPGPNASALMAAHPNARVLMGDDPRLPAMPEKPTLVDFFKYRFGPAAHLLQSARHAVNAGLPEKLVLACLLHDIGVVGFIRGDHGYWGAQLVEPYVDEEVTWAIRAHQVLRFYPDPSVGYEYPQAYVKAFGADYRPDPYIEEDYKRMRDHKWYMSARMITVNDIYSFDPNAVVELEEFTDVIGRNFRQPEQGLGFDNSPVAHMWRAMIRPAKYL
jgi:predicted dinucleotide-utilizing enzyme